MLTRVATDLPTEERPKNLTGSNTFAEALSSPALLAVPQPLHLAVHFELTPNELQLIGRAYRTLVINQSGAPSSGGSS
jgi:hypothetical protein